MKRDEFIKNEFEKAMSQIIEGKETMESLGIITGDHNFALFANLLGTIITVAANQDLEEFTEFIIPFISERAQAEIEAEEAQTKLPKEIRDLLRGLDGSDPSKLN